MSYLAIASWTMSYLAIAFWTMSNLAIVSWQNIGALFEQYFVERVLNLIRKGLVSSMILVPPLHKWICITSLSKTYLNESFHCVKNDKNHI